jgi:hypothetical protein
VVKIRTLTVVVPLLMQAFLSAINVSALKPKLTVLVPPLSYAFLLASY